MLLTIVHDGDAVRHPIEDHGVPETLGINRQVVPAGQILVFEEITESAGILQVQRVNAIAKDSARNLHTLNFCFDWAIISVIADMFCGPGIAKASTRALYMGYCRMASRGPCQVEAKLDEEIRAKSCQEPVADALDIVPEDFSNAVYAAGTTKLRPELGVDVPAHDISYRQRKRMGDTHLAASMRRPSILYVSTSDSIHVLKPETTVGSWVFRSGRGTLVSPSQQFCSLVMLLQSTTQYG